MPKGARVTPLNENNNDFAEVKELLQQMVSLLSDGFGVYLNSGAVVGQLAPDMSTELGKLSMRERRYVV